MASLRYGFPKKQACSPVTAAAAWPPEVTITAPPSPLLVTNLIKLKPVSAWHVQVGNQRVDPMPTQHCDSLQDIRGLQTIASRYADELFLH